MKRATFIFISLLVIYNYAMAEHTNNRFVNSSKDGINPQRLLKIPAKPWPEIQFPFEPNHPVICVQKAANSTGSHNHDNIVFAIDLASPPNAEAGNIFAALDGQAFIYDKCPYVNPKTKITNVDGCGEGYGNHVRILHKGGYMTLYAHLSEIKIKHKEYVKQGQFIGVEGLSGSAGIRHLHFGLHKSKQMEFILEHPGWTGKSYPFVTYVNYLDNANPILISPLDVELNTLMRGIWK